MFADVSKPEGFAIDWLSGNMYFSSYNVEGTASISVARLNGVYRTVLLQDNQNGVQMKKPSSLTLHPVKG